MTKIKVSKDDSGSSDFIEKRRAALERWVATLEIMVMWGHKPTAQCIWIGLCLPRTQTVYGRNNMYDRVLSCLTKMIHDDEIHICTNALILLVLGEERRGASRGHF